MVKRCYIQDYPENFRDNTETRTIASDFIWPSIKSSLTRREKKAQVAGGWWRQRLSLDTNISTKYEYARRHTYTIRITLLLSENQGVRV